MSDAEIRDQAVALLKQTSVGYVNKYWTDPPAGTRWKDALDLLATIGAATPPPPPVPVKVLSSITEGTVVTKPVRWEALVTGVVTKVSFFVDGELRTTEAQAPYVYGGDAGLLTLPDGAHQLRIVAALPDANSATVNVLVNVTAKGATPPPPPPPGKVTMADLKGVCLYNDKDVVRARDTFGATRCRNDWPSDAMMAAAKSAGVEMLPIMCYGDGNPRAHRAPANFQSWANEVKAFVDKWKPAAIEVWNEPWLNGFWAGSNPAEYMRLVKVVCSTVWPAYPNLIVVVSVDNKGDVNSSGTKDWRKNVLAADTTKVLADPRIRPSTHDYCESRTPDNVSGDPCSWDLDRYKCAYQDLKAHGHRDPQVWVTEYGWDTAGGGETGPVSEAQQRDYTVRALQKMLASGIVERAYVYQAKNEDWYGLWRPDGSQRPVCAAVKALT